MAALSSKADTAVQHADAFHANTDELHTAQIFTLRRVLQESRVWRLAPALQPLPAISINSHRRHGVGHITGPRSSIRP